MLAVSVWLRVDEKQVSLQIAAERGRTSGVGIELLCIWAERYLTGQHLLLNDDALQAPGEREQVIGSVGSPHPPTLFRQS
jgi:hypothetical protein